MTTDRFEATFVLQVDRDTAWKRLTEHPLESGDTSDAFWLPGFDTRASVTDRSDGEALTVVKDDEPCAGTTIMVTLSDAETGTQITVTQSGFGDWLPASYAFMAVGWRHIVADLQAYLATGVHARRHLRGWGDLGAGVTAAPGGLQIERVRPDSLADRLGLRQGDVLVVLANAPVSTHDDLVTVLRVLLEVSEPISAEWIRDGELQSATAAPHVG